MRTLTWPSSDPASMRGAAADSGPAIGDRRTHVTVFWKFESLRARRDTSTKYKYKGGVEVVWRGVNGSGPRRSSTHVTVFWKLESLEG